VNVLGKESKPHEVSTKSKSTDANSTEARPSDIIVQSAVGEEESRPTILPPTVSGGAVTSVTAGWYSNKTVTALWSINQNRNSWIGISGVGWVKLANGSDSGIVALSMLGAHAFEKGSIINAREDAGLIQEIYAW
jgi:hypothetical protein